MCGRQVPGLRTRAAPAGEAPGFVRANTCFSPAKSWRQPCRRSVCLSLCHVAGPHLQVCCGCLHHGSPWPLSPDSLRRLEKELETLENGSSAASTKENLAAVASPAKEEKGEAVPNMQKVGAATLCRQGCLLREGWMGRGVAWGFGACSDPARLELVLAASVEQGAAGVTAQRRAGCTGGGAERGEPLPIGCRVAPACWRGCGGPRSQPSWVDWPPHVSLSPLEPLPCRSCASRDGGPLAQWGWVRGWWVCG